jgi:adenylate kinase family enzyme
MNYRNRPDTITFTASYPAAGKGTVITKLKAQMAQEDVDHFEVGAMVRRHIGDGTDFGQLAKAYSSQGLLVPDEVVLPAIEEAMKDLQQRALWFIDGFPRSETQIPAYRQMMQGRERSDRIIHLNISRREASLSQRECFLLHWVNFLQLPQ